MSVLSVQNIQETFIGRSIPRTNTTNPASLADGEVALVNSSGNLYVAADSYATSPYVQIVQRNGDNLVWSSKIYGDKLTGVKQKANSAGQEQIYYIGYNTSSGSLDITAGLDFMLTVIENQDDMMWSEQKKKNVVNVPNNLVLTQMDLAKAIVKNQMKKYTTDGSSITAVMINNGSSVSDAHSVSSTMSVTHGSPYVTYTAGGVVVSPANIVIGSILRIGATGSTRANTPIPVYTVKEIQGTGTSTVVILDQPYAGPTNSALANTAHGILTASSSWGVRFTGKALPYHRDFFKFKRVGFTLQMSGFGATTLTKTQEASYGNGDGRLVLEEESFTKGFEGALNRMTVPLPLANETFTADGNSSISAVATTGDFDVVPTALYNAVTMEFYSKDQATVVAVPNMPQLIKIFLVNNAAQGNTDNTALCLENQLNDWLNSLPGTPFGSNFVTVL